MPNSFEGKITVKSQRVAISTASTFSTASARNTWLDSGASLSSLIGGSLISSDTGMLMTCSTADGGVGDRLSGYGMVLDTPTNLEAYDRSTRTTVPLPFILAGQSNMSGRGLIGDLPGSFPAVPAQCVHFGNDYLWHAPSSEPVDDNTNQVDSVSSDASGVACGLATIDRITDPSHGNRSNQCALIPCSESATQVSSWLPGSNHQDRTTLYGSMLYRALKVQTLLGCSIAAMIWYQGESDALASTPQSTYQTNVQSLIDNMRTDLALPNLPVFVVELPPTTPSGYNSTSWGNIRSAQAALAATHTHVIQAPDGPWTDGTDLHLSTSPQLTLGHSIGDTFVANY
jgi:hypothetical protein